MRYINRLFTYLLFTYLLTYLHYLLFNFWTLHQDLLHPQGGPSKLIFWIRPCLPINNNNNKLVYAQYSITDCVSRRARFIIKKSLMFTPTSPINPLIATLKPQTNGPSYINTMNGTLAIDGWAVTFGIARRGLGGLRPRPVPSSLYQM